MKRFRIGASLNWEIHFSNSLGSEKNCWERFLIIFLIRNVYRKRIYENVDAEISDILKTFVNHFERKILIIFEKRFEVSSKNVIIKT